MRQPQIDNVNPLERLYCYVSTGLCRNLVHGAVQDLTLVSLISCAYTTFADPAKTMNPSYSSNVASAVLFGTAAGATLGAARQLAEHFGFTR